MNNPSLLPWWTLLPRHSDYIILIQRGILCLQITYSTQIYPRGALSDRSAQHPLPVQVLPLASRGMAVLLVQGPGRLTHGPRVSRRSPSRPELCLASKYDAEAGILWVLFGHSWEGTSVEVSGCF